MRRKWDQSGKFTKKELCESHDTGFLSQQRMETIVFQKISFNDYLFLLHGLSYQLLLLLYIIQSNITNLFYFVKQSKNLN